MRAHPRPRTPRAALAAALCTAALALGATACGPSTPSEERAAGPFAELTGPQVVTKAMAATRAADSLTMNISLTDADGPLKAYVSADVRQNCTGTLTMGTTGTAELLKADAKNAYFRFDEAFLRADSAGETREVQEAVLKELKGRWTKLSVSDPEAKDMLEFCDLSAFLDSFEGSSEAVKGAETTFGGRKALVLTEKDGAETYTMHVATEGEPYVLGLTVTGGDEPMTVTFSGFDRPVKVRVPAPKDVVTLD
ncbi:hypothetical protein [Streptomyces sp. NPDC003327]